MGKGAGRVVRDEVGAGLARQEELVFSLHATGMATGVDGYGARRQCGHMCLWEDHLSCRVEDKPLARMLKENSEETPCCHPGGDDGGSDQGGRWR